MKSGKLLHNFSNIINNTAASGRVLDEAIGQGEYHILSRQELDDNFADANTPAVIPDVVDTGFG